MIVDKISFAGGELTPLLRAAYDLEKSQTGLALIENFVGVAQRGITRRPGTRFAEQLLDESQRGLLVPFKAGNDDQAVLVINAGTMRIARLTGYLTTGGAPYALAGLPYGEADLANIRYAQSVDVVFLGCKGHAPRQLVRNGPTNWSLAAYEQSFGPYRLQNLDRTWTFTCSALSDTSFTVTASKATFQAGHVGSLWRIDESTLDSVPAWLALEDNVAKGAQRRFGGNVYECTNGPINSGANAPTHTEGEVTSGNGKARWKFLHNGKCHVRITDVVSATVATVTAYAAIPSTLFTAPTYRWFEAAWSDVRGWPDTVRKIDQRMFWSRGDEWWLTYAADYFSFDVDDTPATSLSGRLASPDGSLVDIQWAIPAGGVVAGTADGEWQIRGSSATDPLSDPSKIRALPDGSEGSAWQIPLMVDGGVLFIGSSRRRLHFTEVDRLTEKLSTVEPSLYAGHILKPGAMGFAYQRDPHRTVWVRLANGRFGTLTWMPSEKVVGWQRQIFRNGVVEDVTAIRSADTTVHELWMIVRREIAGETRRYLEILQVFFDAEDPDDLRAAGAWFVDSGLEYAGPPVTTLSGLDHLEGETVVVFADGGERKDRPTVTAGKITLTRAARHAVVGLPIVARAKTLPFEMMTQQGSSKGEPKEARHVYVEMYESAGGAISVNGGPPEPIVVPWAGEPDKAVALKTGGVWVTAEAPEGEELSIELVCDGALPFTLIGLSPDLKLNLGGG
jgi:hypothetical protein